MQVTGFHEYWLINLQTYAGHRNSIIRRSFHFYKTAQSAATGIMLEGMIKCNGVQTQVVTEGRWVEESPVGASNKHIVLVIPGNPGIPEFYKEFIKTLNMKLPPEVPVWVVGHAGHVQPPDHLAIALPSDTAWNEHYGLTGQIEHKIDFIKKYVPKEAKLYIIGHSIGSWFILNLLKNDFICDKVEKCYLLFPTIEFMVESPNGRFFTNFVGRISSLLVFLSWIFSFFPLFLQVFLIRVIGGLFGVPGKQTKAVIQLLNPHVLRRVLRLAKEEMKCVRERDDDIIARNSDKLWFYYGTRDGWTPVRYYKAMTREHPNVQAELCKRNFYHSFVLQSSKEMGQILSDLINEHMSKK